MKLSDLTIDQRNHLNRVCEMKRTAEAGRRGYALGYPFDSTKDPYEVWRERILGDYQVTVHPAIIKEICTGKRCTPFDDGLERWELDEAI